MSEQLPLFDDDELRERFEKFDRENPRVWGLFEHFATLVIAAGHVRYSADAILHRIRWHVSIETRDEAPFKINDHYSAFYARKWIAAHPEREDFFETRKRRKCQA